MTKPMYCPLSFANSERVWAWGTDDGEHINTKFHPVECTPDCAWAVGDEQNESYACAIAAHTVYGRGLRVNARSLKEDAA